VLKLRYTEICLQAAGVWLDALLAHAPDARGLVLISERGGGNLRDSRNAYIATVLHRAHYATLQVALLTHGELLKSPDTWHNVSLLAQRMVDVIDWQQHQPTLKEHALGMIAHEDAAAAMVRIATLPNSPLQVLVSRSGRPDMAGIEPIRELKQPILLLTGAKDAIATEVNRQVQPVLTAISELSVIRGASHNFEEPGMLPQASRQIGEWFERWLQAPAGEDDAQSPDLAT
jgi:putative phosphoribosyl transferase